MVIKKKEIVNDAEFWHIYSDENKYITRDGVKYGEAYDPVSEDRKYEETDEYIDYVPTDEDYSQAGKILLGVEK